MTGWAVFGGCLGAGAVLAFLVPAKRQELEIRAQQLQATSQMSTDEAAIAVNQLRKELGDYGGAYAKVVAERSAKRHLAEVYGLTPERIASMEQLSQIF